MDHIAPEIAVNRNGKTKGQIVDSISGRSAALYFTHDPSIARLFIAYGIEMREFILVSFLSDQGPLSVDQLARILGIEPRGLQKSVNRLVTAGLVIKEPVSPGQDVTSTIRLTSRGEEVASRIDKQL